MTYKNETLSCLIVDTSCDHSEALSKALYAHGAQLITQAQDTFTATSRLLSLKPDAVFINRHINNGYGSQFIQRVKHSKNKALAATTLIDITPYEECFSKQKAFEENESDILTLKRPWHDNDVKETINAIQKAANHDNVLQQKNALQEMFLTMQYYC